MIPKTKAHIPPEIEQEMTIEPPVKRFFGVLVIGVALVLAGHLAGFPRLTKPETGQLLVRETKAMPDQLPETGQPPAQKAEAMPDQLPDLSTVAEYQFRLSGGDFGQLDSREFAVVEGMPGQIPGRQALAEYQLHLSDGDWPRAASREFRGVKVMPDQISDRQTLAKFQRPGANIIRVGGEPLWFQADHPI